MKNFVFFFQLNKTRKKKTSKLPSFSNGFKKIIVNQVSLDIHQVAEFVHFLIIVRHLLKSCGFHKGLILEFLHLTMRFLQKHIGLAAHFHRLLNQ